MHHGGKSAKKGRAVYLMIASESQVFTLSVVDSTEGKGNGQTLLVLARILQVHMEQQEAREAE